MPLKIATWNVEYAGRLLDATTAAEKSRKDAVLKTILAVDPDIFCLVEGPKGEKNAVAFSEKVLGGQWIPVLLSKDGGPVGSRDKDYATSGTQWVWFFVRPSLADRCRVQPPAVWQQCTGKKKWKVYLWGKKEDPKTHSHYRHPQVLIYSFENGQTMELIGVHLKSKYMDKKLKIERDAQQNLVGSYLDEALTNRIKLATEARDVREYVSARFTESITPALVILGDCNDGPGQDYFESQYLFFDLVSNLEGNVICAEQYFNHALFDYPDDKRWSVQFDDEILGLKAKDNPLLIDHILISQSLCKGIFPVVANARGGKVEHDAYEEGNTGITGKGVTSDHRPVSLTLEDA